MATTRAGKGVGSYWYTFFSEELTPLKAPENIVFERSGTSVSVSWELLTLFEARGFPTYTITLVPSTGDDRVTRQSSDGVIRVTTNESNIVVGGLDTKMKYDVTVAVQTAGGKTITGKRKSQQMLIIAVSVQLSNAKFVTCAHWTFGNVEST